MKVENYISDCQFKALLSNYTQFSFKAKVFFSYFIAPAIRQDILR